MVSWSGLVVPICLTASFLVVRAFVVSCSLELELELTYVLQFIAEYENLLFSAYDNNSDGGDGGEVEERREERGVLVYA